MAHQNIVSMVRTIARRININSNFDSVVGSTDPQVTNMLYLAEQTGQELAARYPWQVLHKIKEFTSTGVELQGYVGGPSADILTESDNWNYIVNDTMWNVDDRIPVLGPNTPETWQARSVMGVTGPYPRYRIYGNELRFLPQAPVDAGKTIRFEFITNNWLYNPTGDTYSDIFDSDDQETILDPRLIILGTVWRWKHARGLEYGQDFDNYERAVADSTSRDGPKPILTMDGEPQDTIAPVAVVPTGNWTL